MAHGRRQNNMSIYDYEKSILIESKGYPFYALIMAAMRQADTDNMVLLKTAFPGIYQELHDRYNAPGGILPKEKTPEQLVDDMFANLHKGKSAEQILKGLGI
jgi:hypothetical protein